MRAHTLCCPEACASRELAEDDVARLSVSTKPDNSNLRICGQRRCSQRESPQPGSHRKREVSSEVLTKYQSSVLFFLARALGGSNLLAIPRLLMPNLILQQAGLQDAEGASRPRPRASGQRMEVCSARVWFDEPCHGLRRCHWSFRRGPPAVGCIDSPRCRAGRPLYEGYANRAGLLCSVLRHSADSVCGKSTCSQIPTSKALLNDVPSKA